MENYKVVLMGFLQTIDNGRCFYKIEGDEYWKEVFASQNRNYVSQEGSNILYTIPSNWYYGLECPICVNPYNNNLFFNINDHEKAANISAQFNGDYWSVLALKTGDGNWLLRRKADNI